MRVPAIVVVNAFPVLTVGLVLGVLQGGMSRGLAFFGSFLATGIYVVALAILIRVVERRARRASIDRTRAD